ncbi:uncharacterized protein LOC119662935 [Teleopsis dalmanni]|uniref:uncharacterized protein LOC119662935 n=1 Tax=Teleopsis dalmanni TaxID=139649 RepID=UPI0018CD693A|nr:uncharacterized protein LOC119662935 [Teleopsis dalmanni]
MSVMKKLTMRDPVISESENESIIQNRQPFAFSDSETMIADTQAVEMSILKEKKKTKKRKLAMEAEEKKIINVEQEMKEASMLMENATHMSMLSLLLVIWTPEFLIHSNLILDCLIPLSLMKKEYEAKRVLHLLTDSLLFVQKQLINQKNELSKCSLKNLVTILLNSEWSTTYLDVNITMETSTWITNSYAENFQGPSSSSRFTTTTSMSSMTVHTSIIPVDVPSQSLSISKFRPIEDILDESFQVGNSRSNIGSICQSICRRKPGSTYTITSPGERGFQVVKLDVYDFSKISKKPKMEWWKEANYRSTFLIQSPVDPNHQLVMKLLLNVTNQLNKIPGK